MGGLDIKQRTLAERGALALSVTCARSNATTADTNAICSLALRHGRWNRYSIPVVINNRRLRSTSNHFLAKIHLHLRMAITYLGEREKKRGESLYSVLVTL